MILRGCVALTLAALIVSASSALAKAGSRPAADESTDGGSVAADIRTVAGKVGAIKWKDLELTIDASDGPVTLHFDRNTSVFLDTRLGSMRDVSVGLPVRASYGPDKRAFWVEVRSRGVVPTPARSGEGGATAAPSGGDADAGVPPIPVPPERASAAETADGGVPDGGAGSGRDAGAPPTTAGTGSPDAGPPSPEPPSPQPPRGPEGPPPTGNPPTGGPNTPTSPEPGPAGPGPIPGGPVRR